ncbi:MAG: CotH kinase family protein [Candidatus Sabulitectum sp.]|nr:CotH kinase family protein [Candidatus Sabulitectum sp.]
MFFHSLPMLSGLLLFAVQGIAIGLEEYYLTIDPEFLDSLYANPSSPVEYPAILNCSAGTADCLVRFRGRSTVEYPKKSWAITMFDSNLLGRERLNLNSEYMDPGMMRNCIAMRTSELMGLPASQTTYSKLYVNEEYLGIYLDIERVDSYYFQRCGYSPVAVFKAHEQTARFMWVPSGTYHEFAYRPQVDSEVNIALLENFIDCINAGAAPLPVDEANIMGYYAVNLALMEMDSGSNNYYLSIGSDGRWRVFPWDRGICLGGGGNGSFYPGLVDNTYLVLFRANSLYQRLILSPENMVLFETYMNQAAGLLSNEIPLLLDSIYNEIRYDLYDDPLSPWSQEEIDQAYDDLIWFVAERGAFLSENLPMPETALVIELEIQNPWLYPGDTTQVRVLIDRPFEKASLKWIEGWQSHFLTMKPVPGFEELAWTAEFVMPDGVNHCPLSILFNTPSGERQYFFHPSYSLAMYPYMRCAHPSVVKLASGSSPPGGGADCDFSILPPQIYGPKLWALPVVNDSETDIDISCCVFVFGDSPHRIFVPSSTVFCAGDSLFLTNSFSLFQSEFPMRNALGNCTGPPPGGSILTMLDPGWGELWERPVPGEGDVELAVSAVILTEINCMRSSEFNSGDWIEFYNPADTVLDIGGFILSDSEGNECMIPMNTVMEPNDFCVLVRDPYLFQSCFSDCKTSLPGLGFGLDSEIDFITVFDRTGRKLLSVAWNMNEYSPPGRTGVLGLIASSLPCENSASWELAPFPGTPGEPNRLWGAGGQPLKLTAVYPNPIMSGSVYFKFTSMTWPVRVFVMDLSGRIVTDHGLMDAATGSQSVEIPYESPAGVYFLVLQSAGNLTARKFTRL